MKSMTIMTAAGILLVLGTADAQETDASAEAGQQEMPATPHQEQATREIESDLFKRLDADRDGSVSREEAQAESSLVAGWSQYDRNSDDRLDAQEFSRFEASNTSSAAAEDPELGQAGRTEADMPATRHQEQAVRDDLIEQLDKDGDGGVSQQEAQDEARLAANWERLDRNHDGKLDSSELDRFEQ